MNKELTNISAKNNRKAWKVVEAKLGWDGHTGYVLHHVDMELKTKDIERYIEWRLEDLQLMKKGEHIKLHHTGLKYSNRTKQLMRMRKLGIPKSELHRQHLSEAHKRYWERRKVAKVNRLIQAAS